MTRKPLSGGDMDASMPDPLTILPDGMIPAAMRAEDSLGRVFPEREHEFRNPFQRDRDRIIHCASFRRLEYKTQVFVNGEGDNYRTRLTHTMEVSQIARTLARALGLNEDLAEAVALSHDLGHTPFGHAGEKALDLLLRGQGGFEHNLQGLRVVDVLEKRYAAFDGLNLTHEVRDAFVKHAGKKAVPRWGWQTPNPLPGAPYLLEVEATMLADDIAYLAHDVDDGLYSGMLSEEKLRELSLWRLAVVDETPDYAGMSAALRRVEGVRRMINLLVTDGMNAARGNIQSRGLDSREKLRDREKPALVFSPAVDKAKEEMKEYLFANFYRHPKVMAVMEEAQGMLEDLFHCFSRNPGRMPGEFRRLGEISGQARAAADYIAGMTDRFAREEWKRWFSD